MTIRTILRALLFVVTTVCFGSATAWAQAATPNYKDVETEILKLVNEHRTGMGLKPLKMNGIITAAAE